MSELHGRRILLGVTGGIAAYKAAELVRLLRRAGAELRVVLTRAAGEFVTPLTFQALSGRPVRTALFDPAAEAGMGHIELARWAEAIVIAPASADFLARLAHGLAPDLLATVCLAGECPLAAAPAMNRAMWAHPATQANVAALRARGVHVWGPAEGGQACGEEGLGRLIEPAELCEETRRLFQNGPLAGVPLLLTAGPTREPLDPVRFLSNRSSGRMGYAIAEAAREAGAVVTLITGPTALPPPAGVGLVRVESAGEMYEAVMARAGGAGIFIGCAAVADYRPQDPAPGKIKKDRERLVLELIRTPDILAAVASLPGRPYTVGFAAETGDLEHHARTKLARKGADLICANAVGEGLGFETEDNRLLLVERSGITKLPLQGKRPLARALIAHIARRYREYRDHPAQDPRPAPGA